MSRFRTHRPRSKSTPAFGRKPVVIDQASGVVYESQRGDTTWQVWNTNVQAAAVGDVIGRIDNLNRDTFSLTQPTGANRPQLGQIPKGGRRQGVSNSGFVGTVAASPGTLPTNYSATTGLTGLTRTILLPGYVDGIYTLGIRLQGTPSAAGNYFVAFELGNVIQAVLGDVRTNAIYSKIGAGSLTGVTGISLRVIENSSVPAYLGEGGSLIVPTAYYVKYTYSHTCIQATCAYTYPGLNFVLDGAAMDLTLYLGLPNMYAGSIEILHELSRLAYDVTVPTIRTNLLQYTSQLDTTHYTYANSTNLNEILVEATDVNQQHVVLQSCTVAGTVRVTASVELISLGRINGRLICYKNGGSFGGFFADFVLSGTGTIGSCTAYAGGTAYAATIILLPTGRYRITITGMPEAAATGVNIQLFTADVFTNVTYNGDGRQAYKVYNLMVNYGDPIPYQEVLSTWNSSSLAVPSFRMPWYSGSNWLTSGLTTLGGCDLNFVAGNPQTIALVFSAFAPAAGIFPTLLARTAGGATATKQFQLYYGPAGGIGIVLLGLDNGVFDLIANMSGALVSIVLSWDGTTCIGQINTRTQVTLSVGAAAVETTELVTIGTSKYSAPFYYHTGFLEICYAKRVGLTKLQIKQLAANICQKYGII